MKFFLKMIFAMALIISALFMVTTLIPAQASLLVQEYPYNYQLPQAVLDNCNDNDNCPEIEVSYIVSNHAWVDKILNEQINKQIIDNEKVKTASNQVTLKGDELQVPQAIKNALDSFSKEQISSESSLAYSLEVTPQYLGHTGSLELFSINGYRYMGGAHGVGFVLYQVLNTETQKMISLDDILLSNKKEKLTKLAKAEFANFLKRADTSLEENANYAEFKLTDNFTFTKDGLRFLYQPYEITPYAMGMPELTISYDKLKGVIKSEYIHDVSRANANFG